MCKANCNLQMATSSIFVRKVDEIDAWLHLKILGSKYFPSTNVGSLLSRNPMTMKKKVLIRRLQDNLLIDFRRRGSHYECTTVSAIKEICERVKIRLHVRFCCAFTVEILCVSTARQAFEAWNVKIHLHVRFRSTFLFASASENAFLFSCMLTWAYWLTSLKCMKPSNSRGLGVAFTIIQKSSSFTGRGLNDNRKFTNTNPTL